MALVVESGSGAVANANSYADLAFIRAYNLARGREFTDDDDIGNARAIQAMDYLESLAYQGFRTFGQDQPLSWPREDVSLYGDWFPNDEIPIQLKNAQAELAWQSQAGIVLFPTQSGQQVKRRKIGQLEREFFAPSPAGPYMPAVDAWLAPLLETSGTALRVERV